MSWALIIVGGVAVLLPGYMDPFAPVNGLTLLGLVLVAWGVSVAVKNG
jgi:hypothetical protein